MGCRLLGILVLKISFLIQVLKQHWPLSKMMFYIIVFILLLIFQGMLCWLMPCVKKTLVQV